jgi:hypothetical protein
MLLLIRGVSIGLTTWQTRQRDELRADVSVAMAALRNKKTKELELDRIAGTRLTLETQVCDVYRTTSDPSFPLKDSMCPLVKSL